MLFILERRIHLRFHLSALMDYLFLTYFITVDFMSLRKLFFLIFKIVISTGSN